MRTLVSTVRTVSAARAAGYEENWSELHRSATSSGARAWRFRSAANADLYIEFIEFRSGSDPRDLDDVRAALQALEQLSHGETHDWVEASRQEGTMGRDESER